MLPLATLPTKKEFRTERQYLVGAEGWGEPIVSLPLSGNVLYFDDQAFGLADASGLATMQTMTLASAEQALQGADGMDKFYMSEDLLNTSTSARRRLVCSYLLENAVQLNVQTTLFA